MDNLDAVWMDEARVKRLEAQLKAMSDELSIARLERDGALSRISNIKRELREVVWA